MKFYSELFLEDFQKIRKLPLFLPLGTLEWHGAHLPLGCDLIKALEITKILSKKIGGIILPPLFVGTDKTKIKKGIILKGIDLQLNKSLMGSIYYLRPGLFYKLLESLIYQIKNQGFKKLVIVTGHGGSKQVEVLDKIKKSFSKPNFKILVINPLQMIRKKKYEARHAGFEETSLLWILRPDLIKKSQKTKFNNRDIIKLRGEDPRKKVSKKLGKEILKYIIEKSIKIIKKL